MVLQTGLSNGADELMWGNGYNRGLTAYHGALGANALDANQNGTNVAAGSWDDSFWVGKLEKTNSGSTDDLTVRIMYYNLDANNTIDTGDPAAWTRTVGLSGVDATFDTFQMKIDGASSQYPGMDELRIGESWVDVTGVPEPGVAVLGGLVLLGLFRRRR